MVTTLNNAYYKGLNDLKISKLLTDAEGSDATYEASKDLKIVSCEPFNAVYEEQECQHDEVIGDIDQKLKEIDFNITVATLDLDVLALLDGSITETSGTEGAMITENILKSTDTPNYIKIELSTLYDKKGSGISDKHVILHKCKATLKGGTIQQSQSGYTTFTISGKAIPLDGTYTSEKGTEIEKPVRSIIHYATKTAIA